MIPTLIATNADTTDVASVSFTSGIDSTYDHYMFVLTGIHPETDAQYFSMQFSATDNAGGFDEDLTTAVFSTNSQEGSTDLTLMYNTDQDKTSATTYQRFGVNVGADSDQSANGILHLFNPASTTYQKNFFGRINSAYHDEYLFCQYVSGYINETTAIDEIIFKFESGNMNGTIQMYGIA